MNNVLQNETVRNVYSDSKGTGVVSTLIFAVVMFAAMFLIAHFRGY